MHILNTGPFRPNILRIILSIQVITLNIQVIILITPIILQSLITPITLIIQIN
jgi:hypothetical protein